MARRRSSSRRGRGRKRGRGFFGRPGFNWRRGLLIAGSFLLVICTGWVAWLDYEVRSQFEGKRWSVPATVYARPLELYAGRSLTPAQLRQELTALGYRQTADARGSGTWAMAGGDYILRTRAFRYWDGEEPSRRIRVALRDGRIARLRHAGDGRDLPLIRLDPAPIGNIYPGHHEDRLLVKLEDVPETLIQALLVVEDKGFHSHWGVSPTAILRAAAANIRAGRVVQGGSTITQQLVKNFYLSSARTLPRKINEAVMALLLEWHYDKDDILETYINEVYLAQDRDRSIHGFALGSRHLFGEPLRSLTLEQQALLVAMVKGPSYYNPRRQPERAMARRNLVLDLMEQAGVVDGGEARAARRAPLGVREATGDARRGYPAFLDLVQRHLNRDYEREDLQSEGLRIFTTMAPAVQWAAEAAVERQLDGRPEELEAAVVMVDVGSGEVLALTGGRNPRFAGFNRAVDARRPIGSLIKPAVYLTALEKPDRYGLGSVLDDSPLIMEDELREAWEPRNFDREFRGNVLLMDALAHSWNVPTIRLGMDLGLQEVRRTVDRLGGPLPRRIYPSFLLGTGEMAPVQVAQMYQTLASGGFRSPLRSVREVTRQDGTPLSRYPLSATRAFEGGPVHLVNMALVRAMREGTGRGAYRFLPDDLLVAGKTGTTGDTRDSWFAGFGADLMGVVWLGRDDNTEIGLTGSSGALPVWADIMGQLEPRGLEPHPPEGVETVWIDEHTGLRSARGCDGAIGLPYLAGHGPEDATECGRRRAAGGGGVGDWLRGLFQ